MAATTTEPSPSPEAPKPFKWKPSSLFVRPRHTPSEEILEPPSCDQRKVLLGTTVVCAARAEAGPSQIASSFSQPDASESCVYFAREQNHPPCRLSCTVRPRPWSPNHYLFVTQRSFQPAEYVFICILLFDRHPAGCSARNGERRERTKRLGRVADPDHWFGTEI